MFLFFVLVSFTEVFYFADRQMADAIFSDSDFPFSSSTILSANSTATPAPFAVIMFPDFTTKLLEMAAPLNASSNPG
jgi:hypothetical protein